jgi:hypothetical protein
MNHVLVAAGKNTNDAAVDDLIEEIIRSEKDATQSIISAVP